MKQRLRQILSGFKDREIVVWGDLILDQYVYTSTSRVSREAPVLVAEYERERFRLGGAGNVVLNLLTLGAKPIPVGFVGKDNNGRLLLDLLRLQGVENRYLVAVDRYRTPLKSRILAGGENTRKQQVLRIDTLPCEDVPAAGYRKLAAHLQGAVSGCGSLVISDYLNQAVKPQVFSALLSKQPRVLVTADSRDNLAAFPGVTVATPNEPEMRRMFPEMKLLDDGDFLEAGSLLLDRLEATGVVLKRGHLGMIVFERGKKPKKLDVFGTTQIVDVTGAGDTVLAVVSLGLAAGADLHESARLANIAGGIVVMREGASPIRMREMLDAIA